MANRVKPAGLANHRLNTVDETRKSLEINHCLKAGKSARKATLPDWLKRELEARSMAAWRLETYRAVVDRKTKKDAHNAVRDALRRGRLVRLPCEECGNPKTDAHHDDYTKPLAVRWLCRSHHLRLHAEEGGHRSMTARGQGWRRSPRRGARVSHCRRES